MMRNALAATQPFYHLLVTREAFLTISYLKFDSETWRNHDFIWFAPKIQALSRYDFEETILRDLHGFKDFLRHNGCTFEKTIQKLIYELDRPDAESDDLIREKIAVCFGALLKMCQSFPEEWSGINPGKKINIIWRYHQMDNELFKMGSEIEQIVAKNRFRYSEEIQSLLQKYKASAAKIFHVIRDYYLKQPIDDLDPPIYIDFEMHAPMQYAVFLSPPTRRPALWLELIQQIKAYVADMKEYERVIHNDRVLREAAAAEYFTSWVNVSVGRNKPGDFLSFETAWMVYGKLFRVMEELFQINPNTATLFDLRLDLEDALEYWMQINEYIQGFPDMPRPNKSVTLSDL